MSRHLKTYLEASQHIEPIETSLLLASGNQLRSDLGDLSELCASIRVHGLLQPILVRPRNSRFEIVCGHRRYEACRRLMKRHVDCIVRDLSDMDAFELSLIENVQRDTLSPIEEARAYKKYVVDFGWGGIADLSKKIGKSQEYISHRMSLLDLPPEILEKVSCNKISLGQAQEIVWVRKPEARSLITDLAENEHLSVSEIRKLKHELDEEKSGCNDDDDDEGRRGGRKNPVNYAPINEDSRRLSADRKAIDDAILSLRVALVRIDSIVSRVSSKQTRDHLMHERYELHSIIDRLISAKTQLAGS